MSIRIGCRTQFDITETGVKNRSHKSRFPFNDLSGQEISDELGWNRARNQQSNWETINQVISLRTLPENITHPIRKNGFWYFEFDVVDPASILRDSDPVGYLLSDCNDVPMILGLTEPNDMAAFIISTGTNANTWFNLIEPMQLNTSEKDF